MKVISVNGRSPLIAKGLCPNLVVLGRDQTERILAHLSPVPPSRSQRRTIVDRESYRKGPRMRLGCGLYWQDQKTLADPFTLTLLTGRCFNQFDRTTQTRLDGFQNNLGQKVNPSSACPAPWWVASKEVGQTALTYELVEQVVNKTPLNAVSGLMRSQNADSLSGYAEIPSKVGEPPLKGRSSPYNKRRAR